MRKHLLMFNDHVARYALHSIREWLYCRTIMCFNLLDIFLNQQLENGLPQRLHLGHVVRQSKLRRTPRERGCLVPKPSTRLTFQKRSLLHLLEFDISMGFHVFKTIFRVKRALACVFFQMILCAFHAVIPFLPLKSWANICFRTEKQQHQKFLPRKCWNFQTKPAFFA